MLTLQQICSASAKIIVIFWGVQTDFWYRFCSCHSKWKKWRKQKKVQMVWEVRPYLILEVFIWSLSSLLIQLASKGFGLFQLSHSHQADYHGGWDSAHHQHIQIRWRQVHVCGQEPFRSIQQHRNAVSERYLSFFTCLLFFLHRVPRLYLLSQGFKLLLRGKKILAQAWNW